MKKAMLILLSTISLIACNSKADKEAAVLQAKQMTVDSMNTVAEKQKSIDSINTEKQRTIDSMKNVETKNNEMRSERMSERGNGVSRTTNTSSNTMVTHKRKGLSPTATGALVGAGAGAITGAMVDHKKGEGAIVGGLIGAAAGAGTGAIITSEKKRKAQQSGN